MGEQRNAYRISMGKPEGKRPLGRKKQRWEHNIKIDLREIGWDGMDWIDLAQDRDQWRATVNTVINFAFHKISGNSSVAERLVASQEGFSSIELVQ
jgi:hypothetical protein